MATKDITDRQVCEAYRDAKACDFKDTDGSDCWPYTLLQVRTGEPEKVCIRAMERAADRGLIDYGVSLQTK